MSNFLRCTDCLEDVGRRFECRRCGILVCVACIADGQRYPCEQSPDGDGKHAVIEEVFA